MSGRNTLLSYKDLKTGTLDFGAAQDPDVQRILAGHAVRFSQQCAAIPGPFQVPARTNLKAIRAKYAGTN